MLVLKPRFLVGWAATALTGRRMTAPSIFTRANECVGRLVVVVAEGRLRSAFDRERTLLQGAGRVVWFICRIGARGGALTDG